MIEFLDSVPPIARQGGPNAPAPEVQEFMEALQANPGKWAAFPLERKTKPKLPEPFQVAGRNGRWYASFPQDAESDVEDLRVATTA